MHTAVLPTSITPPLIAPVAQNPTFLTMARAKSCCLCFILCFSLLFTSPSLAFESDELLLDDEEFGLEGGSRSPSPPTPTPIPQQSASFGKKSSDSDSKIGFLLEHAFGDSEFSHAGNFSARLKTLPHGRQTLMKLRLSREDFTVIDKENFKALLLADDFYRIRLPSNVISPPGKDYIISSVKARCLSRDGLDEHFVIHMEGVNILAVNYGYLGMCQYPRQLKVPKKWLFNSHTVLKNLKNIDEAPRTPTFSEDIPGASEIEDKDVVPLERSLWAKYWMYLIPLGLVVMNVVTQVMNLPEEQAGGTQTQQPTGAIPRDQNPAVRRR